MQGPRTLVPVEPAPTGNRASILALLALACVLFTPAAAVAQTPAVSSDTLTLDAAVTQAREANPALRAARLQADAAAAEVSQTGALPDPQLSFGLMNRPVDGFGAAEPMTMNTVQLMQRLPWPGKLGYAEARAAQLADAQTLDADEAERQLVARVKTTYFQVGYMDRALVVMRETRDLLRTFLDVSSTMYSVGSGLQQDVLRAQVAVATMTENITVMEQNRVAMQARLNALLGRDATAPIEAVELPAVGAAPAPVDTLLAQAVAARPALAAARARTAAATAGYRAARRTLYPDFTVTLAYGQRPQFDDMATLMLGISLPLWAARRQLPMRREMQAMEAAASARERDLYNETFARITELRADAARARALTGLYASAILPQARAAVESALSAYRVGKVEYMTLVDNEMTVNRYEIESLRLTAEYQSAVAGLDALVGSQIGGTQ